MVTKDYWRTIMLGLICLVGLQGLCNLSAVAEDCRKGKEYYDLGTKLINYEERRELFQKAVDLCPSYAEARVNLADALENLATMSKSFTPESVRKNNQLIDQAIIQYKEAIKTNNRLFEAYLGLAENYFRIGIYTNAKEAYEKALQLNPHGELARRAKNGLTATEKMLSQEKDGFKSAKEIVSRIKSASPDAGFRIMGFEEATAVRDRERFINIVFDEWSSRLNRQETIAQLDEIGKALSSADLARCQFIVEGHTDPRGGLERNQKLSVDRADAVKQYLVTKFRIDERKISTQGFGYDRPRFPNDSPENMLKNRRVELVIIDKTE